MVGGTERGGQGFAAITAEMCPAHKVQRPPDAIWIYADARMYLPEQGWKIHISAGPDCERLLGRALPVLRSRGVSFKVLASRELLVEVSCGSGGLSQVGKFITVYPPSEEEAVTVARELDAATAGCEGPAIVSDRVLRSGSVIHYRYGPFGSLMLRSLMGVVEPAIRTPSGELTGGGARHFYRQPEWVRDPFGGVDTVTPLRIIAGRYAVIETLFRTTRGRTLLTVDTHSLRRAIVKEALPWVVMGLDGSDARDRLRHEFEVLRSLRGAGIAPDGIELFEQDGALFLAMEDVAGPSLETHVMDGAVRGRLASSRRLMAFGQELARLAGMLHKRGWVHRDLKPSNIVLEKSGARLVDFELCTRQGAAASWGTGTIGYCSPQQVGHGPASIADDIYSLGAVLFFTASGAHPRPGVERGALYQGIAPVHKVVEKCMRTEAHRRYPSAAALARALRAPAQRRVRTDALPGPEDFRALALDLGRKIVDQLCAAGPRPASLYLNDGASGALLAVTEMVRRENGAAWQHALREAAAALLHRADEPSGLRQLHGLYVGEAGIAAALLRAGLVLEDATLVNGAAQRASAQFGQPHTSPDVFHGTAGRVWLALRLWEVTAQPVFLSHATEGADWLLAQMDRDGRGRTGTWTIPAGYDGLSGQAFFGFAHGCAGIGAVMTEMFAETGAARFRAAAALVARRLRREAKHSGAAGATWPTSDCDPSRPGPFWCHGSAGIGEFFLRYGQATRDPTAMRIAQDCARAVIACSRWIGHTQCHGLSGSIEFLIDCHQAWRSRPPLRHARKLGAILLDHRGALEAAIAAGELGYMSGASGAVGALLRLAAPTPAMRITGAGFLPGAAA